MQIICHGLKEEDFPVEFSSDHKIFIGRDESNSIPVSAEGISRFHAILIEDGGELFLQDNDSRNGTFLNYKQVRSRQKLVNGDIIQIGYRLIRVDFKPEQDAVVLDFVPPEETEVVANDSAKPPLKVASPEPERTMVASDEIERTMVASETMLSRSSMSDKALLPGGTEIGKYVIIKRLGKGGMGEVYLAKHKTLGICRALKVLSKDSEDGDTRFLERFLREAKLASEIRHPNVVGVMDVETGEDCGFPYIVMEYVDGGSLRNSLTATKRLSEEQAVVIVEAVASALQAAEEHNIVHRDIKPDNIMFTRRGEVKLADLGIAKVDGKDNDFTKTNMMIGTPAYLPPEQAQNAKAVDARADIYSLGATFYEMLTGQQPYPGENSIEVLHKLFLTPVPDPRKINPEISAASAAIAMKMMAKDPKDRFQNATELLNRMEKTFPPHTASEAADLIRKAVSGVSQSNASFSSGISSSTLSLWWLKLPNKKFVLPVAGLVFAICVLCILFPFLGHPAGRSFAGGDAAGTAAVETEVDGRSASADMAIADRSDTAESAESSDETVSVKTVPDGKTASAGTEAVSVPEKTYDLQIRTTPDSDILVMSPDGRTEMFSTRRDGSLKLPGLKVGRYRIRIMQTDYHSASRDLELKEDMTLDLPLEAVARKMNPFGVAFENLQGEDPSNMSASEKKTYGLQIKTTPGADIRLLLPDGRTETYSADPRGLLLIPELKRGKYEVRISLANCVPFSLDFELRKNMTLDLPLDAAESVATGDKKQKPDSTVINSNQLLVTTDQDIVDSNDGMVSLREALDYAQSLGTNPIVSFWKDCRIKLNSALAISRSVIIDGSTHNITIVGPEEDSMFHVSESDLRLKNLTLISDRSGDGAGIMDISSTKQQSGWFDDSWSGRLVELVSVKDGGTARNLWMFENIGVKIDGGSHIHRLAKAPRSMIKICAGSILEDSILEGAGEGSTDSSGLPRGLGNGLVYGSLKNSTVLGATLRLYPGGICENLTIGELGFLSNGEGTVNGLKVGFGGLFGYEPGSVLNGTISFSGGVTAQDGGQIYPKIGPETDIVFDLTDRTEKKGFSISRYAGGHDEKRFRIKNDDPILDDMKAFSGVRGYTVQVKTDQSPGTYKLAGNAADFKSSMSLKIGNTVHSKALSVGKSYTVGNSVFSLNRSDSDGIKNNVLNLTIRNRTNAEQSSARESEVKNTTLMFDGIIDSQDVFTIKNNRIIYTSHDSDKATDVRINGVSWRDLDKPFVLGLGFGVMPDYSKATIIKMSGRGKIALTPFQDRAELNINDNEGGPSRYRVTIEFQIRNTGQDKLHGVVYLLSDQTAGLKPLMANAGRKEAEKVHAISVLQRFVLGSWQSTANSRGERYYPDLESNFERQEAPALSYFYNRKIPWEMGADLFYCKETVRDAGWAAIYSGYVVAPFTGKFRFLGFCDDMMVVRFNRQIVLDYGCRSLTTGLSQEDMQTAFLKGSPPPVEMKAKINNSPLYSKYKLEIGPDNRLAKGPVLSVQKGQVIPIDILLAEECSQCFSMILFIERLNPSGKPYDDPSEHIFLFRTSSDMPQHPPTPYYSDGDTLPDFNSDSPIWTVTNNMGRPLQSKKTQ